MLRRSTLGSFVAQALFLSACATPSATPESTQDLDAGEGECLASSGEVELTTEDGVNLIADLETTGNKNDPAVMLLHMIPPGNSKANYPSAFINALVEKGYNVLNINRRGAPGSGGDAKDAYQGELGKFDALAGYTYLSVHPCQIDMKRYAVVGASNGTTTTNDFIVYAGQTPELHLPKAFVFLSGGRYTENQNKLKNNLDSIGQVPGYIAYPTSEASWNNGVGKLEAANWACQEYNPGAHGTGLFQTDPGLTEDILDFFDPVL